MTETARFKASQPTVLVTGSNRGLGLAFTEQYAALGWNVLATCRDPGAASDLRALASTFPATPARDSRRHP